MMIKHWTQIAGGGRNGFIDNRPYIETVSALEKYVTLDDSERSVICRDYGADQRNLNRAAALRHHLPGRAHGHSAEPCR